MHNKSIQTQKRGRAVILDPLLNKGTAFSQAERDGLHLNGLLPPHVISATGQLQRAYASIINHPEPLEQYIALSALQDRNEHLYYKLLEEHLGEFMPIVYTPTVGLACQNFSHVFQRARGLWFNPGMQGRIRNILEDAVAHRDVQLIVATDNESILGIGDQGAGGMAISVGKLALYVAGAGIHPAQTLPISLDVGTNNEALLADELYLGWRDRRIQGQAYADFISEFVDAVKTVCPGALLQWEDFRKDNALSILRAHRDRVLSFNDDIQGTGAMALAGLYSALRITETQLTDHRIVIHGAGAAGMGIANQIKAALRFDGVAETDLHHHIAVLDSKGLLVDDQTFKDTYKADLAWPYSTAADHALADPRQRQLLDVVRGYKPTVLIGTSGQAGAFSKTITECMAKNAQRPIIMPFSNPTSHSEATPENLLQWTEGRVLIATGSPFEPVAYGGHTYQIGQGNNVFIFPGLGLGALLAKATAVTDDMVTAASKACAEAMLDSELQAGMLYPAIERLRQVSIEVARAVASQAACENRSNANRDSVEEALANQLWDPDYPLIEPS